MTPLHDTESNVTEQNQMDAMMSFWREAWNRAASAAPQTAQAPNADPMAGPGAWMPSPEAVKRMQGAFLDAMASSAEQYMRSPQFLDSMRQSLESAIGMRTQMEEFLRKNMGDALRTPGDASAQVLMALTEIESRLTARLDELAARLDAIVIAGKPTAPVTDAPKPKSAPTGTGSSSSRKSVSAPKSSRRR